MKTCEQSRDEIRIGVTWADSGWCWLDSRFVFGPLQVWVAATNADGGMFVPDLGRRLPVRLIQYDDQSNPAIAIDAVHRLIQVDQVDVLVSSASSEIQHEAIRVSEAAGVLNLNVSAPDPALFAGTRFHLQCGISLAGYYGSRPGFWKRHGLERIAYLHADFPGWSAVGAGLHDEVVAAGLKAVFWEGVPCQDRWSTRYGPYAHDFDNWSAVVRGIADSEPDAVIIAMPSPAEYRIVREMRAQGVWFPYLEMTYGPMLSGIGLGPEDLAYQFFGRIQGRESTVCTTEINVGGSREEIAATCERFMPGVPLAWPRSYSGPAVWAHLVAKAGTLDAEAVMNQARTESGKVVTWEGPLAWTTDGGIPPVDRASTTGEIWQLQPHPWSGAIRAVRVSAEGEEAAEPVLTRTPVEQRPAPWLSGAVARNL